VIDARAYLTRVGLRSAPAADLAGVRELVLAHTRAIPFENLDAFLGRGVDLAPAAVARKLLTERRGGWCFEHNLLLGEMLRSLGITVTDLAARVLWFRPPGQRSARTHRLLLLELEGRQWLADVGFGILTLTGVLALEAGVEQPTQHEPHRLIRTGSDWVLEARLGATWQPVYQFDLHPHWPEDFEPVNYQLAHDPASPFVTTLRAARATATGRLSLKDLDLDRRGLNGELETRRLRSVPEILDVLEGEFDIAARGLPGIAERLSGLLAGSSVPPP
jgi:N-hydroxyarylamine O-acetyltransferase